MKKTKYKVAVPVPENDDDPRFYLTGFLDMLRYEGATVIDWSRTGDGYIVTLASRDCTYARWRSMGLYPFDAEPMY